MNAKALIGTVIETIIKVLVLAAAIILVFKGATKAYDFGYRVFAVSYTHLTLPTN